MPGLLIDILKLKEYKVNNLINFLGKLPKTKNDIGVVFIIDKKTLKIVKNSSKKLFINSSEFIDNIKTFYFVIYDNIKKLIEIRGYIQNIYHIEKVLDALYSYAPRDSTIWTGIIPKDKTDSYVKLGFNNPIMVNSSPLGYKTSIYGFALYKKNIKTKHIDTHSTENQLYYIENQGIGNKCVIFARFTKSAIKYLKHINKPTNVSEKELSGSLKVGQVTNENGTIVFELVGDPDSVVTGLEEEVDAVWSRYNFHTHPKKAYVNNGVTNGWPSSQDYLGFIQLKNHTIFHSVVTLEGIYIISFSPDWIGKLDKINYKYVLKHYDIDHKKDISYDKYVDIINNKKYKGGNPLFIIKYISWKGDTSGKFPIFYKKTGHNCLSTDDAFNNHSKYESD